MKAHEEGFKFFAGCCKKGIYDNMKTAVKEILVGKNRIFNEKFVQMASHSVLRSVSPTNSSA